MNMICNMSIKYVYTNIPALYFGKFTSVSVFTRVLMLKFQQILWYTFTPVSFFDRGNMHMLK